MRTTGASRSASRRPRWCPRCRHGYLPAQRAARRSMPRGAPGRRAACPVGREHVGLGQRQRLGGAGESSLRPSASTSKSVDRAIDAHHEASRFRPPAQGRRTRLPRRARQAMRPASGTRRVRFVTRHDRGRSAVAADARRKASLRRCRARSLSGVRLQQRPPLMVPATVEIAPLKRFVDGDEERVLHAVDALRPGQAIPGSAASAAQRRRLGPRRPRAGGGSTSATRSAAAGCQTRRAHCRRGWHGLARRRAP